jgi:muramoyltetrapeptide carboxypeptidase
MDTTVFPPDLKTGDEIRIVAPASVVKKEYIKKSIAALSSLGYNITLGRYVFSEHHQFAGTDSERISDFQEAIDDKNVKAVFCARGGYGSVRIINKLDFSSFNHFPKWVIGFSDITVFHSLINQKFSTITIHAPMPINSESLYFSKNLKCLDDLLKGKREEIKIPGHFLNRTGVCQGKLVGGNLSILCNLQATPYEINTQNAILFIEDIGEQLYHLDRMMNNLLLSGKLSNLKGLLAGGFADMQDKKRPFGKTAYEIVTDAVKEFAYPAAFDFPAGHIDNNTPFLLGAEVELKVSEQNTVLKYV